MATMTAGHVKVDAEVKTTMAPESAIVVLTACLSANDFAASVAVGAA
jgi:hypothetical protein